MPNKEQKRDLSVRAIPGVHVARPGMDSPQQRCPPCSGLPCEEQTLPRERTIGCPDLRSSRAWNRLHSRGFLLGPKTGTASDATFANFSRSTTHLVKTTNRKG